MALAGPYGCCELAGVAEGSRTVWLSSCDAVAAINDYSERFAMRSSCTQQMPAVRRPRGISSLQRGVHTVDRRADDDQVAAVDRGALPHRHRLPQLDTRRRRAARLCILLSTAVCGGMQHLHIQRRCSFTLTSPYTLRSARWVVLVLSH